MRQQQRTIEITPQRGVIYDRNMHPLAMSVLGTELLAECFQGRRETLGDLVLSAKRNSLLKPRDDAQSRVLDSIAAALNPLRTDLAQERAEHVLLFNLLGDPLLRLRHPETATVNLAGKLAPGESLTISGTSAVDGQAALQPLRQLRAAPRVDRPLRDEHESSALVVDHSEAGGHGAGVHAQNAHNAF